MGKIAVRFDDKHKARSCIRFVSDRAWDMVSHLFPAPAETGRPRKWPTRTLFEAALYVLWTGTQWRFLPGKFPPFSTVQRHFYAWRDAGLFELINHMMVFFDRQRAGRECQPTGATRGDASAAPRRSMSRSSPVRRTRLASSCRNVGGSSSGPSHGSTSIDVWPRTMRGTRRRRWRFSS